MTYLLQPRYTTSKLSGNSIEKQKGGPLGGFFFISAPTESPEAGDLFQDGLLMPKHLLCTPLKGKSRKETEMPDIFETNAVPYVSEKARTVIESLDPKASTFTEIEIVVPKKNLHPPYFYWHVDPFRQTFDFEASLCKPTIKVPIDRELHDRGVTIDGVSPMPGQSITIVRASLGNGLGGGSALWKVKTNTEDHPRFWRESDLIKDNLLFKGLRHHIFLSDYAFKVLNKAFPGQLLPEIVAVTNAAAQS
jgi:hypothetical protein